jgi:hypothetical protein
MNKRDKITKKPGMSRYVCDHCAARPPRGDYMVHDAVWAEGYW